MDLKEWVRAARKHKGLTQTELGEKLSVTKGNVSAWENGRHEPSFGQLKAIAEFTGYPLMGHDLATATQTGDHQVTESEWSLLQDVLLVLSANEIGDIRRKAAQLEARYREVRKPQPQRQGDSFEGGLYDDREDEAAKRKAGA